MFFFCSTNRTSKCPKNSYFARTRKILGGFYFFKWKCQYTANWKSNFRFWKCLISVSTHEKELEPLRFPERRVCQICRLKKVFEKGFPLHLSLQYVSVYFMQQTVNRNNVRESDFHNSDNSVTRIGNYKTWFGSSPLTWIAVNRVVVYDTGAYVNEYIKKVTQVGSWKVFEHVRTDKIGNLLSRSQEFFRTDEGTTR